MPVQVINSLKKRSVHSGTIRKLIRIISRAESKKKLGTVTFVLLGNAAMRRMNKKFLNHDYPTDVISFDLSTALAIEGEVYIGLDKAAAQARECGVPLSNELLRLAAHGFLHILGHEDHTPKKRSAMLKRGDAYIAQLKYTSLKLPDTIIKLIEQSLAEDIGRGDITTLATIPESLSGKGFVKAKSSGILCGMDVFDEVFRRVDPSVSLNWHSHEGQAVSLHQMCVSFSGSMRSILTAERTALNFLQRLSGIATLTNQYVDLVRHTKAKIIDTRKTTPVWRELEKYAVRTGGGSNHRMGLYDMFLIKDNHITAAGGIAQAIQRALQYNEQLNIPCAIEVETKNLDEITQVLQFPVARIMLDNMSIDDMRRAVGIIAGKCEVEASGGVSLATVHAIAETGVDLISVGALTHSAPAMDLSLLVEKV